MTRADIRRASPTDWDWLEIERVLPVLPPTVCPTDTPRGSDLVGVGHPQSLMKQTIQKINAQA